jgi:hypothetical protein
MKEVVTEILWHNSSTNEIQIWFMDGREVVGRGTVLGEDDKEAFIGPPWRIVGVGDFDRDGTADILWHNSSTNEIQIWFMNGREVVGRGTVLGEDDKEAFIGPPWRIVGVGVSFAGETLLAERAISSKWQSLTGLPGKPLHPGRAGLIEITDGFRRHYARGSIYRRNQGQPFFVEQTTDQRYDQLGGPRSFLGFPVSDFEKDPGQPDSGVTRFENGAIYFWPDLGALEMRQIALRYVGFHCFGETDELSAADEPYFTFGVVPILVERRNPTPQTQIYTDVDAGESRADLIELYRGLPFGAVISITLVEHDEGNPEKYRENVDRAVERTADRVVEGLGAVPVVGIFLSVLAEVAFVIALPAITDALNKTLGTEDDHLGTVGLATSPKDMMRLTRVQRQDFHGIQAHLESPLISGGGASYKAYFDVEAT